MSIIEKYLKEECEKKNSRDIERTDRLNSYPCGFCGHKELVQKFRNVVGKIDGSTSGGWSMFGGSISGYISGSTSTLPILSCRNCGNERKIYTHKPERENEIFWHDMHNFYHGVDNDHEIERLKKIKSIYLQNPIETRQYAIENKNYKYNFYNEIIYWRPSVWASAGFEIPKVKVQIRHWIFWKKEIEEYMEWEYYLNNPWK